MKLKYVVLWFQLVLSLLLHQLNAQCPGSPLSILDTDEYLLGALCTLTTTITLGNGSSLGGLLGSAVKIGNGGSIRVNNGAQAIVKSPVVIVSGGSGTVSFANLKFNTPGTAIKLERSGLLNVTGCVFEGVGLAVQTSNNNIDVTIAQSTFQQVGKILDMPSSVGTVKISDNQILSASVDAITIQRGLNTVVRIQNNRMIGGNFSMTVNCTTSSVIFSGNELRDLDNYTGKNVVEIILKSGGIVNTTQVTIVSNNLSKVNAMTVFHVDLTESTYSVMARDNRIEDVVLSGSAFRLNTPNSEVTLQNNFVNGSSFDLVFDITSLGVTANRNNIHSISQSRSVMNIETEELTMQTNVITDIFASSQIVSIVAVSAGKELTLTGNVFADLQVASGSIISITAINNQVLFNGNSVKNVDANLVVDGSGTYLDFRQNYWGVSNASDFDASKYNLNLGCFLPILTSDDSEQARYKYFAIDNQMDICSQLKSIESSGFCDYNYTDALVCSSRGDCVRDNCSCHAGYSGTFCEFLSCSNADVPGNYTQGCANNGICVGNKCLCDEGFAGPYCTQKVPLYELVIQPRLRWPCGNSSFSVQYRDAWHPEISTPLSLNALLNWTLTDSNNMIVASKSLDTKAFELEPTLFSFNERYTLRISVTIGALNKTLSKTVKIEPREMYGEAILGPRSSTRKDIVYNIANFATNPACNGTIESVIWRSSAFEQDQTGTYVRISKTKLPADGGPIHLALLLDVATLPEPILVMNITIHIQVSNPTIGSSSGFIRQVLVNQEFSFWLDKSTDPENANQLWNYQAVSDCTILSLGAATGFVRVNCATPGQHAITFTLTIGKRSAVRMMKIYALENSVQPRIAITSDVPEKIGRSKRLLVSANTIPFVPDLKYSWVVTLDGELQEKIFLSRTDLRGLTLQPDALVPNSTYVVSVTAIGSSSNSTLSFDLNTAPLLANGLFIVSPDHGTTATFFNISAIGWESDDVKYTFEFQDPRAGVWSRLGSFKSSSTISTQLPAAPKGTLTLRLTVQNTFGESKVLYAEVGVTGGGDLIDRVKTGMTTIRNRDSLSRDDLLQQIAIVAGSMADDDMRQYRDELLDAVNSLAQSYSDSSADVADNLNMLAVVAKYPSGLSPDNKRTMLSSLNTMFQVGAIDDSSIDTAASVLGNAFDISDEEFALSTIQTIGRFAQSVLQGLAPALNPTQVVTDNFHMILLNQYASSLTDLTVSSDYTSDQVYIPQTSAVSSLANDEDPAISVQLISYANGTNPYGWANNTENSTSGIVEFQLAYSNGTKVALDGVIIRLALTDTSYNMSEYKHVCKYWNEENSYWDTYGCSVWNYTSEYVTCYCNHTTSFSSFVQYDPNSTIVDEILGNEVSRYMPMIQIALHSVFLIAAICLLIIAILFSSKQPVKSRFIAPYIGLTAIIIEAILSGIVRNALFIRYAPEDNFVAFNIMSVIVTSIVSPLNLLALFTYVWQLFRYVLNRNLYRFISRKPQATIAASRLTASTWLYSLAAGAVAVVSITYFVIVSAVTYKKTNAAIRTAVPAVSYLVISLVFALAIFLLFLYDIIVNQMQELKRSMARNEERVNNEAKKNVGLESVKPVFAHFVDEDPFKFRIEALIMVIAMILPMTASYIIGLYTIFGDVENTAAVYVAGEALELVYIALKIVVFGGIIAVFAIKNHINQRTVLLNITKDDQTIESMIHQVLTNPMGYRFFELYSEKEFSTENLIAFKQINTFKEDIIDLPDEERAQLLLDIHEKYVVNGSAFELNLSSTVRKSMTDVVGKGVSVRVDEAQHAILKLHQAVMTNLADTYSRFIATPDYQLFKRLSSASAELTEFQ